MTREQRQIRAWMINFGQETPDKPVMPSLEVRKLRAKLILEEALEAVEGLGFTATLGRLGLELKETHKESLTLLADGLGDSIVVILGTAIATGIDMEPVMQEILRSNETKLWDEEDVAPFLIRKELKALPEYRTRSPRLLFLKKSNNLWLVKNEEGKVIKPPSYSPAELDVIIHEQQQKS